MHPTKTCDAANTTAQRAILFHLVLLICPRSTGGRYSASARARCSRVVHPCRSLISMPPPIRRISVAASDSAVVRVVLHPRSARRLRLPVGATRTGRTATAPGPQHDAGRNCRAGREAHPRRRCARVLAAIRSGRGRCERSLCRRPSARRGTKATSAPALPESVLVSASRSFRPVVVTPPSSWRTVGPSGPRLRSEQPVRAEALRREAVERTATEARDDRTSRAWMRRAAMILRTAGRYQPRRRVSGHVLPRCGCGKGRPLMKMNAAIFRALKPGGVYWSSTTAPRPAAAWPTRKRSTASRNRC